MRLGILLRLFGCENFSGPSRNGPMMYKWLSAIIVLGFPPFCWNHSNIWKKDLPKWSQIAISGDEVPFLNGASCYYFFISVFIYSRLFCFAEWHWSQSCICLPHQHWCKRWPNGKAHWHRDFRWKAQPDTDGNVCHAAIFHSIGLPAIPDSDVFKFINGFGWLYDEASILCSAHLPW